MPLPTSPQPSEIIFGRLPIRPGKFSSRTHRGRRRRLPHLSVTHTWPQSPIRISINHPQRYNSVSIYNHDKMASANGLSVSLFFFITPFPRPHLKWVSIGLDSMKFIVLLRLSFYFSITEIKRKGMNSLQRFDWIKVKSLALFLCFCS